MFDLCRAEPGEEQREADPAGQAVDATQRDGSPCTHLLSDGPHARHHRRVPPAPPLYLPGQ